MGHISSSAIRYPGPEMLKFLQPHRKFSKCPVCKPDWKQTLLAEMHLPGSSLGTCSICIPSRQIHNTSVTEFDKGHRCGIIGPSLIDFLPDFDFGFLVKRNKECLKILCNVLKYLSLFKNFALLYPNFIDECSIIF